MVGRVKFGVLCFCLMCSVWTFARTIGPEPSHVIRDTLRHRSFLKKIPYKQLIVPVGLMTYGIVGLESHALMGQDKEIRDELQENIDRKFTVDDYSQYLATTSVFAMDAAGVPAKHNLKQRMFATMVAHAIMATTTITVKSTGTVWRPDSSANNSFPSGHTADSIRRCGTSLARI